MIICASTIPQVLKTYRVKRSRDLSIAYLAVLILGMSLLKAYSVYVKHVVFILANTLARQSTNIFSPKDSATHFQDYDNIVKLDLLAVLPGNLRSGSSFKSKVNIANPSLPKSQCKPSLLQLLGDKDTKGAIAKI
jgi:hypothetical protein